MSMEITNNYSNYAAMSFSIFLAKSGSLAIFFRQSLERFKTILFLPPPAIPLLELIAVQQEAAAQNKVHPY